MTARRPKKPRRRERLLVGLGVAALGVALTDRVLLSPGPRSAGAVTGEAARAERRGTSDPEAAAVERRRVADVLSRLAAAEALPGHDLDAIFGGAAVDAGDGSFDGTVAPGAVGNAADTPEAEGLPVLTATRLGGRAGAAAIIDGVAMAVGDSRGGMTLLAVEPRRATVRIGERIEILRLD